jgi:hypothetical protein
MPFGCAAKIVASVSVDGQGGVREDFVAGDDQLSCSANGDNTFLQAATKK